MILITGAAGKTGQAIIKALANMGSEVRALIRLAILQDRWSGHGRREQSDCEAGQRNEDAESAACHVLFLPGPSSVGAVGADARLLGEQVPHTRS